MLNLQNVDQNLFIIYFSVGFGIFANLLKENLEGFIIYLFFIKFLLHFL